jgi:hypothetical protein
MPPLEDSSMEDGNLIVLVWLLDSRVFPRETAAELPFRVTSRQLFLPADRAGDLRAGKLTIRDGSLR